MRSTWTDSRLDEFAKSVDRRFDKVDSELHEIRTREALVVLRELRRTRHLETREDGADDTASDCDEDQGHYAHRFGRPTCR